MRRDTIIKILQWSSRIILAGVLILAGILKIQDNSALFESVAYITWLPVWLKLWVVDLLPWVEILLAGLLLIRWKEKYVLPVVVLIFFGFLGYAIYGTVTGLEGDCGCFGDLMDSSFGPSMILRNTVFVGMAAILLWRPGGSPNG